MTYSSGLTQTHQTVVGAVDFWSALMKSSRHGNDSHVASVRAEFSDKQGHETASVVWFLVLHFRREHCVFSFPLNEPCLIGSVWAQTERISRV